MPMKPILFLGSLLIFGGFALAQSGQPVGLLTQNPHYFRYQNKPLVLIGSGEHYGAVLNLDFAYKPYLNTLRADGLNTTRLFMGAYVEKLGDFGIQKNTLAPQAGRLVLPWTRSTEPGYALGGNKFDLSRWDDAYFARLRDFMAEARRQGIIVEITLFSSYYGTGWPYSAFTGPTTSTRRIPFSRCKPIRCKTATCWAIRKRTSVSLCAN